jgi:hypothetical protein
MHFQVELSPVVEKLRIAISFQFDRKSRGVADACTGIESADLVDKNDHGFNLTKKYLKY